MKIEEQFNQKLLVEGNDDQHVVWSLCSHHKVVETFDVIESGSIEGLFESITVRLKEPDVATIGFILDADNNVATRWQSIRNTLIAQGLEMPESLPNDGLVIETSSKRIGVWIMPNNQTTGMLEDFATFLIPHNDPLREKAKRTLEEIESAGIQAYKTPLHRSKAFIHTWLAWQEAPGTPMGRAITTNYLKADAEHATRFVNWLNRLFN